MHRFTAQFLVVAVALIGSMAIGAAGPDATAQDVATSTTPPSHPLVGSWLITTGDPSRPETLNTFWADGNALFTLFNGLTVHGTWVATGPRTAALTMFAIARPPDGDPIGLMRISSTFLEVAEAGDMFRGEADIDTIAYDGAVLESVHVSVVGTRIAVGAMGTTTAGTPTLEAGEMVGTPAA